MKAAFVITLIAVINHARAVHTEDKTNIGRKESHSSGGEGSQSLVISSRAKLTNENVSEPILPEPYEMDMLDGSDLNEDESFVLVPLKTLVKNPRKQREIKYEDDEKGPLYVIIPYKELSHTGEDLGEPVNMISIEDRADVRRSIPNDASTRSDLQNFGLRRKERSADPARHLSKRKGVVKRSFKYPFLDNREGGVIAQVADSETLWEVPLSKFLKSNRANPYSLARIPKATYKSKKSLGVNQLTQELISSVPQKPRVLTEFRDLNFPKSKENINLISKPRKASNGSVNITLYISNLIPPSEVDNTKITNSGKLFKSGCLKFSIKLEKPNGPAPEDCCMEECCNGCCKSTSPSAVVSPKVSCCHLDRITDDKHVGPGNTLSCTPLPENTAKSPAPGRCPNSISESPQPPMHNHGPHAPKIPTETGAKIENIQAANRDVTSLLMQLMGLEKKSARKPVQSNPAQAVLMDSDIVKELQKLLTSNQGGTTAAADVYRANYVAAQTRIAPHNPKAKVIADALNLFSKFTSVRQPPISQNK